MGATNDAELAALRQEIRRAGRSAGELRLGFGGCTLLLSIPAALAYRWLRRRQLRRQLAPLPPAERATVLLPLRQDRSGDTRRLVEPLIRDLCPHAQEVTPA